MGIFTILKGRRIRKKGGRFPGRNRKMRGFLSVPPTGKPQGLALPPNLKKNPKKTQKTVDRLGKRVYTYYYVRLFKKVDGIPAAKPGILRQNVKA
jgi:hypothetical protein